MMKKIIRAAVGVLALTVVFTTAHAAVVYEDNFDNDGLAINTGAGGGLSVTALANATTWGDSGNLDFSPDNGDNNERATVTSFSSFDLSDGFELTVMYSVSDIITDTLGNRFSFGLVNQPPTTFDTDPFGLVNGTRPAGFTSFGLNVTVEDSLRGLTLNTGSVSLVAGQSGFVSSTTVENTMTLTVDAAGDYDLVLNGSSVGSGESGLDLSSAFYFAAFSQDDLASPSISSVLLTTGAGDILAPIATAQSVETFKDTPVEITLTGFDYEGSNLTYSVETFPSNGTLEGATNIWIYTPTNDYLGADSFTFIVNNGATNSTPATVLITISRDVIVYQDDFSDGDLAMNTEGTGGGAVLKAEVNAATWTETGGTLDFSPDNGDANERAIVSSKNSFYLPGGFELTVTYSVSDITTDTAGNRFSFGLVNMDPDPFDTDPFALINGTRPSSDYNGIGLNVTTEDSLQGLTVIEGVGEDSVSLVPGQASFISSTTVENAMTLAVDAAGYYELVLNGSSVGSGASGLDLSAEFYFVAFSQDNLANPSISSVSLSAFAGENLAPIATAQSVATSMDTPVEITLTGFDYAGSNLTYSVETQPANGILIGATNRWTYTPADGYLGADSFTFTVHNGATNSAPATVSITVSEDELYEGPEYGDAFTNPADDPALPNVLLIGDSISIGYTVQVRKSLAGKADVFRIPSNGKDSAFGLANLNSWLTMTPGEWDVIHFNWGLWDLCYRNPESSNQGNRDKEDGTLTATLEEYGVNMEQIVARMKETDATLMWCATTPVPEGELGRFEGDATNYNAMAGAVMATNAVSTNDLHSYALLALPEIQLAYGDVHFTDEGYIYLGEQVAREIEALLQERFIGDLGIGVPSGGTGMVLRWQAQSGASYGVMATTNLVDGPWIEMTNGIAGDDNLISVTNTLADDRQFFRVYLED